MNFDKPPVNKERRGSAIEILHSDPDTVRVYALFSDKYLTVDLTFPDLESHDSFLLSRKTFDDFLNFGGIYLLSGESSSEGLTVRDSKNSTALVVNQEKEFSFEELGITAREFDILNNVLKKHFFRQE